MKEPKLRYSEAFYSVQGEGKFVGVPSVFLRTFGCNFRCKNFGLPRGTDLGKQHNPDVIPIVNALDSYKTLDDLPIIHTGCDTYASIYPEFKRFMMDRTVDEVVEHLLSLTPQGKWTMDNGQDIHLVITGGEPLLGWQRFYQALLEHPKMGDLQNVTFETNTTQKLRPDFDTFIRTQENIHITFSCSPKLSVSGESKEDAIRPEIAKSYADIPNSSMYFKFVVGEALDVSEAEEAVKQYQGAGINVPVYLMPLGGHSDEYTLNIKEVADLALQLGFRFSPRLHLDLYGNAWGT